MAGRRTNLALLGALILALASGWIAFSAGTGWGRIAVIAHGVIGLAVVVLTPWKSLVARRGLAKRRRGTAASIGLTVLIVLSVAAGLIHSGGRTGPVAGLSPMQIHVGAALLAIPLVVLHLVQRPTVLRRTDLSRRNVLRGLGVVAGGGMIYAALEFSAKAFNLPGARRRFTGSHEVGSFEPARMPVTQWLNDPVPEVDASEWRLAVIASGGQRNWSFPELRDKDHVDVAAILDCTGGWFAEQRWQAVPLQTLLPDEPRGRSIVVRSTTGYARRFPIRDLDRLFVATAAGGVPLSAGHGYPARLVAPGRRGFWWVKWVDLIAVDDRPWWLQLPFPAE